jgi:tetratricopeptide (TPR) repeat protein
MCAAAGHVHRNQFKMAGPVLVAGMLFLAALGLVGVPTQVWAQQAAYASTGADAAQTLAKKALDCLRRGEDGLTTQSRLQAYQEGLDYARRAAAADDGNADAHFAMFANHGRILLLEGAIPNPINLMKISKELDRALELNPDHADALASKGGLYRQLPRLLGGNQELAEQCLKRAIALDPRAVGARVELAQLYRDQGDPGRGVPLLEKAAEVAAVDGKHRQEAEAQELLRQFTAR